MEDTLIIQKAIEEIENKRFGVTEHFLQIHEIVYADHKPKVLKIEKNEGTAIVYFAVKDEKFYFVIYLDTLSEISVSGVDTTPFHAVYFKAVSEQLNFDALCAITTLSPTNGWRQGELRKFGKTYHSNSAVMFEPNPEPGEFEPKLEKLLTFLEQDRDGVHQLVDKADGWIQVFSEFHNGNTMIGGHHIDINFIKRIAALNLTIDFDICANGNFWKD